jgi:hypothetical protein
MDNHLTTTKKISLFSIIKVLVIIYIIGFFASAAYLCIATFLYDRDAWSLRLLLLALAWPLLLMAMITG